MTKAQDRRVKVAALLAKGRKQQYIADSLHVSLRTVENDARRIREAGGKAKPKEEPGKGVAAGTVKGWGAEAGYESPTFDFERCEETYENVPLVTAAINTTAEMVAGTGFYIETPNEELKSEITEFCQQIDLRQKLIIIVKELLIYGNSFWERLKSGNIKWLPPKTMEKSVKRDKYGIVQQYTQRQGRNILANFAPDEVLHLKWNVVGSNAYGTSIIKPNLTLIDMKKTAEKDMKTIMSKHQSPRVVHILRNADNRTRGQVEDALNDAGAGDDLLISFKGAAEYDNKVIQIDPRARFQSYIDHLEDNITVGLQCPILTFGRAGARISDASATAMLESFDKRVRTIQAYLKEFIEEEIIALKVGNVDPKEFPHLIWGTVSKTSYTLRELALFFQSILRPGPDPVTGRFLLAPNQIISLARAAGLEIPEPEWPEGEELEETAKKAVEMLLDAQKKRISEAEESSLRTGLLRLMMNRFKGGGKNAPEH